jgi:hypothetical protein
MTQPNHIPEMQEFLPERKGVQKIVWLVISFVAIITTICAGLAGLYRYASYDSICLDVKLNNYEGYVLRVINPDMELAEAFLKDYLVGQFSPTIHETGYPWVETRTDTWPAKIIWKLPFRLPGQTDVPQESRSSYKIYLNNQTGVSLWYFRETDLYNGVLMGIRVYIVPSWSQGQMKKDENPFLLIRLEKALPSMSQEAIDQDERLYEFMHNALDHLRKCHL